ncbi:MAG TPA: phosphatidylglycerol lysyltransferase domain-containing protein [Candidatus Nanoarchaeia archaeon]|nr:phosphatidylglycerol lysyltransferase domain-containing protein [Candidatus Nanoarchaeia archaeon]
MDLKQIALDDKGVFDKFFRGFSPKASEYTFTNIFCWRKPHEHKFAVIGDHLLISSGSSYFQPIGPNPHQAIKSMLNEQSVTFERVEENALGGLPAKEDVAMFDYVYSVEELASLDGAKFASKRNFVNQCKRYKPNTCMLDESTVKSFLSLAEEWCDMRGCKDDPNVAAEDFALREALANYKVLGLFGICINVEGKIAAFALGERLNDDTFVEHFEKADTRIKGIYAYLLNELAKALAGRYRYINREQDLGVEGLRKAKQSWNPVCMIKKYRITNVKNRRAEKPGACS